MRPSHLTLANSKDHSKCARLFDCEFLSKGDIYDKHYHWQHRKSQVAIQSNYKIEIIIYIYIYIHKNRDRLTKNFLANFDLSGGSAKLWPLG